MADGRIEIEIVMDDGSVKKGIANLGGLENAGKKAGTSIKAMVTSMGLVKVASAAFDVLKNSIGGAINRFDILNQYPKVMKQMGYSTDDVSKSLVILKKGVDGLPTTLQDLTKSAQSFAVIEKSATKGAQTATALNDAFLASGASAEDASRGVQQYSQMLSSGTVDLQSWKTLQETMPYALTKVAASFGLTGKSAERDLYAKLKSGDITMEQLNARFTELDGGLNGFANTARTATGGIGTSITNLKNSITNGLANTLTAIDAVVKAISGKTIAENLNSLKGIINGTFAFINGKITESIPYIQNFLKSFKNSEVITAINIIKGGLKDMFSSINPSAITGVFGNVGSIIQTALKSIDFTVLATGIVGALSQMKMSFIQYGTAISNYWKTIFTTFGPVVTSTLGTVLGQIPALFQTLVSAVTPVISSIAAAFAKLDFSGIQALISAIIPAVTAGFQTMMGIVGPAIDQVINSFVGLWNAAQPLITVLAGALMPAFQIIGSFLGGVFKGILDGVAFAFDAIKIVIEILTPVISFLVGVFQSVSPVLSTVAQWVGNVIGMFTGLGGSAGGLKEIMTSSWNGIKSIVNIAKDGISIAINVIKSVFSALSSAGGSLKGLLSVAWSGIKSTISVAGSAISGVINGIKGFFSALGGAGNSLKGAMSSAWSGITGVISSAKGTISGIINDIKGIFNSLRNINLSGAGSAIMNGFLGGLKSSYEKVKDFVGGIAGWMKEHKGPISYDKRLLIPAGNAIMQGLNDGLKTQFKSVQATVGGMAGKISDTLNSNIGKISLPTVSAEYALSSSSLNSGQIAAFRLQAIGNNIGEMLKDTDKSSFISSSIDNMAQKIEEMNQRVIVIEANGYQIAKATYDDFEKVGKSRAAKNSMIG
ncbi:tape measure protein [Lactococcus sp.]|uniref:tape measure protein n=1 Tax=Lactococcus sp. TaxID=44273 RepID=UPI0035AE9FA4